MTVQSLSFFDDASLARCASSSASNSFSCSVRSPFFARSNMAFLLLSLSALARLNGRVYYAAAKIDGGTKDRGSKIFAICELEGVRQLTGEGFGSTVGDGNGGDAGGDGEVREERVRSVFGKGFLKTAIFEEVEVPDDEGRGARGLDAFEVCVVRVFAESLKPDDEDVLCDLEEEAAVNVRLEQLWSFGKRC